MTKQLTFLLLVCYLQTSFAQEEQKLLLGVITNDSISVEGIHVFNKNSGKGTITNDEGIFQIMVKENDTLLITGVQFYYREISLTNDLLRADKIKFDLLQKINELEEVQLKSHNLLGNITIDAENAPKVQSKIEEGVLDFSGIDFSKPVISDIDDVDRTKPPDASRLTNPNAPIGGNVLGLLSFALDPLIDEVTKIGKKKREEKRQLHIFEKKSKQVPDDLVAYLGEDFFIKTLKIPYEEINDFIAYCKPKGLHELYIQNKRIEAIDLLIKEAALFNKTH